MEVRDASLPLGKTIKRTLGKTRKKRSAGQKIGARQDKVRGLFE
jgi:hypothetical protein